MVDERAQLHEALARLQQEKGETDGMMKILTSKLHEMEEANFDLHSCMATFEAETRFESDKKVQEMQKRLTALESQLSFMSKDMQNAERVKLRALKEVEELQRQKVETKRRDAERRLMATKRRKHESFLASQSMRMSQQSQQVMRPLPAPVPVVETAVQTEPKLEERNYDLKEENARLMSYLLTGTSRDLLTLLNGTVVVDTGDESALNPDEDRTQPLQGHSSTPTQFVQSSGNSLNDSMQQSPGSVPFSQSVFSQLAGRASTQARASMLSVSRETDAAQNILATERAQELYDVLGKMMAGDVSAVALAPVFVKYLAASTNIESSVFCSVLRVMYSVMHHSTHFQHFLLVTSTHSDGSSSSNAGLQRNSNSMEHPRITLPGLRFTSLDDYLSARTDYEFIGQMESTADPASEQRQLRSKLLGALCLVIKNNLKEPAVVKDSLCVLYFWVDLSLTLRPALTPDFKPLLASNIIPAILLAPKGFHVIKAQALGLLSELLRVPGVFAEVESEIKKSLLFNRCAKMLGHDAQFTDTSTPDRKDDAIGHHIFPIKRDPLLLKDSLATQMVIDQLFTIWRSYFI
ncbi:hypothetical protein PHPALM_29719 [Phytophthora palmivora]|uniref:Uncharacterized protein n=1 Tax=Phytophthora palmivora TaxID=4796 RepID=A0A2P4X6X5_9STRA|nr:hypothetical protein PHPALM_29719 [Phytophthora palmivora]